MKDNKKRYWKGLEQLSNDPEFVKNNEKEFPDYLPLNSNGEEGGPSRRDFLKMMGFGIAAASLAACEAPVRYAIPYLNKPVDVDPGIPNYYASTFVQAGNYCPIVVKTREGRPIKIEGNNYSPITQGGTVAQVQASILSLYDNHRLKGPLAGGNAVEWPKLDQAVTSGLRGAQNVRVVSNTILSPSTQAVINEFTSRFGGEHIMYDSHSSYALIQAHQDTFNVRAIPSYDFSQADVIVSFGADFLGSWINPVEFNKQYSKTRKLGPTKQTMSRHYQFESVLSITGSNADYRSAIRPSQEAAAVAGLYQLLSGGKAAQEIPYLQKAAKDLLANRGRGLVVSSSNEVAVQRLVSAINNLLGNYGTTIDISKPAFYRQGDDRRMAAFVRDVQAGRVDAVIFYDCNPVYDYAGGQALGEALSANKVKLSVSTTEAPDETSVLCQFAAPDNHFLESWNDYEPKRNHYSLAQPAIAPIFKTRQAQESFLTWSGATDTNYYNYLQNRWRTNLFAAQQEVAEFQQFWDKSLYIGVYVPGMEIGLDSRFGQRYETAATVQNASPTETPVFTANTSADLRQVQQAGAPATDNLEMVIYEMVGVGTGRQANNPWLQEMPDPVTKATWDNYLTIPISLAQELGLEMEPGQGNTKMVNLTVEGISVEVPVLVQPGQAKGTVGLAIGYGRKVAGKVAENRGVNAYPFIRIVDGVMQYYIPSGVEITATDKNFKIANAQTQHTYMGRETVIQDSILKEYQENPKAGRYEPMIATAKGPMSPEKLSLWDGHLYPNHHWGMVIDLNSCTGCSACTVSCHIENNVPVVGKDEVLNRRDMFWLRIDRYYSSENVDSYAGLERAAENPEVVFQPMLCQQCNNAPCETVCPVAATTHSSEGLNQMTYNRCIGTRYCANNCPYKVRRFNWFKYHDNVEFADTNPMMNSDLGKMVLNPDVTVRARGVMEKCTFCVQRIQRGKLEAKRENRRPEDGEIVTACAQACPTDAIIFGDLNDENSQVTKLLKREEEGRAYSVLKEIGTRPNVFYLTKIRNKDEEEVTEEITA